MHLRHKQILINERKRLLKFDYYFSQQRIHSNPFFRDEKWISVYQREKRTAQEARKVWAIYGLIRGINMDKPEGGEEKSEMRRICMLASATFVFPPVLPSTTSGFPFKTSWITEEPLGFSTRYIAYPWMRISARCYERRCYMGRGN